jgi:NADH-quinone oxidoreductase subunit N
MGSVSDKLEWTAASIGFLYPELITAIGLLLLIIVGLITKRAGIARFFTLATLLVGISLLLFDGSADNPVPLFGGMLRVDDCSYFLRCLIGFSGILVALISETKNIVKNHFEFFTLLLSVVLGAQLLVMSQHFAIMILSLELMSIPAYILAGYAFDKTSAEAGMKYFIYGSVATAFMVFGVSWIYGLSDTLVFSATGFADKLRFNDNELFLGAGLMVLGGLLFKMAATPFHFWAPDVYQSAPMPVLALFSTIPKIAAGAVLIKLIVAFGLNGGTRYDWQSIVAILSIVTLTVGNFSALSQKNVKRLMAYSSIGQAGFLLVPIATLSGNGFGFFLFYATVLVLSTVLVFLLLAYFEKHYQTKNLADFQGLGRLRPTISIMLAIGMLSLVGLPLTAGFTAKLFIFSGLLEAWSATGKDVLVWLFGFGLLNTVVSLYYYLRIPYFLFLKEPPVKHLVGEKPTLTIFLGSVLSFVLLWLFFQPNSLMGWINRISFVP